MQNIFKFTAAVLFMTLSTALFADSSSSSSTMPGSSSQLSGSSSTLGSSSINTSMPPSGSKEVIRQLEKPLHKQAPPAPKLPPLANAPALTEKQANYFHPGILVLRKGFWEGSDHLYNLTNNIGVYVNIIKPDELQLEFNSESIKKIVVNIFDKVDINPVSRVPANQPALPSFEVEILIYPIERGFVASVSGSLFESVTLERVKLDEDMVFQAITWAKETLIVGPKGKFNDQLFNAVSDIANSFADRYETYEKLRLQE